MRKYILLFAAFCLCAQVVAQDWKKLKKEDFEFRVEFPVTPESSQQSVPTDIGPQIMDMYSGDMTGSRTTGNLFFSMIRTEYPAEYFENADDQFEKERLDGAVNGAVTNVNGSLLSQEFVSFNGYPGREIIIGVYNNTSFLHMNVYLVDNKLYILQVIADDKKKENEERQRFFESFDLIKTRK